MLTGRAFCGACGGPLAAAGRDYLACSNARKLGTCGERKGIRRAVLEGYVLELVRDRLMEPDAVKAFVSAYHQEINAGAMPPPPSGIFARRNWPNGRRNCRGYTTPSQTASARLGFSPSSRASRPR
jgi:hypothetical protein